MKGSPKKKSVRPVHFVASGQWLTACGQRFGRKTRTQLVSACTCAACRGSEAFRLAARARLERLASAGRTVAGALLLAVLLVAGSAPAAESPQFVRLIPSTASTLVPPESVREAKPFYEEWRRGAGHFAELLSQNEEVKRRVGAPLDVAGVRCVVWTKLVELVDETRAVLSERCKVTGRQLPTWLGPALRRAQARASEECGNSSDGPGGTRVGNLGLRYLREWGRLRAEDSAKREAAAAGADLLQLLGRLAQVWEEAAAARGGLAPAGASLPLVNPCLLDKRFCPPATSTMGDVL